MKKKLYLLLLMPIFLLSGCYLKSVHPLVKPEASIKIPNLAGSWQEGNDRWTFIWDKESVPDTMSIADIDLAFLTKPNSIEDINCDEHLCGYLLLHEDIQSAKVDSNLFFANFVELGEHIYMDLYPVDIRDSDLIELHYFPVHTFSRIEILEDSLSIKFFKAKWIEDQIMKNKVRIKHEKLENSVLITAPTHELQKFISKYGHIAEAYEKPLKLSRIKSE